MNFPHKGQWHGALMFSLICAWINGWVNNREGGDLGRHRVHYDAILMFEVALDTCVIQATPNTTNRCPDPHSKLRYHYNDVIINPMASQITSLTTVYSIVYLCAHQRKHQSSASLAFVRGIHRWPVNSPHKGLVTRKMFPFDDVIVILWRNMHVQNPVWGRSEVEFCFFSH